MGACTHKYYRSSSSLYSYWRWVDSVKFFCFCIVKQFCFWRMVIVNFKLLVVLKRCFMQVAMWCLGRSRDVIFILWYLDLCKCLFWCMCLCAVFDDQFLLFQVACWKLKARKIVFIFMILWKIKIRLLRIRKGFNYFGILI